MLAVFGEFTMEDVRLVLCVFLLAEDQVRVGSWRFRAVSVTTGY